MSEELKDEKKRFRPTVTQVRDLQAEIERLSEENRLLKKSNDYLNEEVLQLCALRDELSDDLLSYENEVHYYENRGFWEKLKDLLSF